jgi:hypothetical protein
MTVNRERQKTRAEDGYFDIDYLTLEQIARIVATFIEYHGKDAVIVPKDGGKYDDGQYLAIMVTRDETDDEMAHRIMREEALEKTAAAHEKREYERLKQKFG